MNTIKEKNSLAEVPKDNIQHEQSLGNIDAWIATREEFLTKVATAMKETKDYHIIQGKKSLAKGGAEKIASIFKWSASFIKDTETYEMFGSTPGLLVYKCQLKKAGKIIGEGRGASSLQKNNGDPNKTIKMAQKSAYIDAVIRSSGLSDIFTQDLEDMTNHVEILNPIVKPKSSIIEAQPQKSVSKGSEQYPISKAQIGYLKGLYQKKENKEVASEELAKLTRKEAHDEIERLLSAKDQEEIPTIQLEEQ